MTSKCSFVPVVVFAVLGFHPAASFAQSSIAGVVRDTSGAVHYFENANNLASYGRAM